MTITASNAQAITKQAKENQTPQLVWDAIEIAAKNGFSCCDCWVEESRVKAITLDLIQHGFSSIACLDSENPTGMSNIAIYWKEFE